MMETPAVEESGTTPIAPQKKLAPFTFRSGGFFGSGKQVRDVQAAVRHMDRHPDDGIFHLRNGTLARWLEDQGEERLAEAARRAAALRWSDPRVPLETFLLDTGLVRRPRLSLRPQTISLGYVLVGQTRTSQLKVGKGRGRGYLFGRLHSGASCLFVDPTTFSGRPCKATISVNSESLPIGQTPQQFQLLVESNASEEPVAVPVSLRVMGMPSWFGRFVLRPLAGILVAGLLGLGLGALLGRALALAGAPSLSNLQPFDMLRAGSSTFNPSPAFATLAANAPLFWAIVIGVLWAALGGIAGLLQPPAYPILYATGVRLLRTLLWTAAFIIAAAVAVWSLTQIRLRLGAPPAQPERGPSWSLILLGIVAFAILPAVIGEVRNARLLRVRGEARQVWSLLRPALLVAVTVVVCVLLMAGAWVSAPAVQKLDAQGAVTTAQSWLDSQFRRLDSQINAVVDQYYLRYYDRRAPLPTPGATPAATGTPQGEKR